MNRNGFSAELVDAFIRTTDLYKLSEKEKQFVFRVLNRFRTMTIETRERMTKAFGDFKHTDEEWVMATIGLSIFYAKNLEDELLIGLYAYQRQELILRALRGIVTLSFPRRSVTHMLDVFSLGSCMPRITLLTKNRS